MLCNFKHGGFFVLFLLFQTRPTKSELILNTHVGSGHHLQNHQLPVLSTHCAILNEKESVSKSMRVLPKMSC